MPKETFQTLEFLETAIKEGAHLKLPEVKKGKISPEQWIRQRNILGIYFGSPAVLSDISRMYGFTNKERPNKLLKTGIKHLWQNCSKKTQREFPESGLGTGKPRLKKKHGKDKTVRADQILLEELPKTQDPDELNKIMSGMGRKFFLRNRGHENSLFISVQKLALSADFHFPASKTRLFAGALEKANIAHRKIKHEVKSGPQAGVYYYYYMLNREADKAKARDAFMQDPGLTPFCVNSVEQIYGESVAKLPTLWALQGESYKSISPLLRRFGIFPGTGTPKVEKLLEGCPEPIFRYTRPNSHDRERMFFYPVDQEEALAVFIKEKQSRT